MLFINENGGNVLDADVIRSMYRVRKDISNIKTKFGECVYLLIRTKDSEFVKTCHEQVIY